mmetsp:Transcript_8924/g.37773  ORF Transcript_8924/g.37773 Transcript_8924/m.37773 type:complete len:292 (+) Transcript_8924:218-1093(+)
MRLDERATAPDARDVARVVGFRPSVRALLPGAKFRAAQDEPKKVQAGDERVGVLVLRRRPPRRQVSERGLEVSNGESSRIEHDVHDSANVRERIETVGTVGKRAVRLARDAREVQRAHRRRRFVKRGRRGRGFRGEQREPRFVVHGRQQTRVRDTRELPKRKARRRHYARLQRRERDGERLQKSPILRFARRVIFFFVSSRRRASLAAPPERDRREAHRRGVEGAPTDIGVERVEAFVAVRERERRRDGRGDAFRPGGKKCLRRTARRSLGLLERFRERAPFLRRDEPGAR